jgi:hypothetical protein
MEKSGEHYIIATDRGVNHGTIETVYQQSASAWSRTSLIAAVQRTEPIAADKSETIEGTT